MLFLPLLAHEFGYVLARLSVSVIAEFGILETSEYDVLYDYVGVVDVLEDGHDIFVSDIVHSDVPVGYGNQHETLEAADVGLLVDHGLELGCLPPNVFGDGTIEQRVPDNVGADELVVFGDCGGQHLLHILYLGWHISFTLVVELSSLVDQLRYLGQVFLRVQHQVRLVQLGRSPRLFRFGICRHWLFDLLFDRFL